MFCVTADGEFLQNELKLPGHSHNSCCFSCQANKSDIPHNDFRATAKWRSTLTKPGTPLPGGHPLGAAPGLNTFSVHYDTLHCLEEGVAAHALANTFFDLVVRGHAGAGTQDQNLQAVYRQIRQQYLEQGIDASHRIKKLSLTNFSAREKKYEKFPDLTGFKAKQIRYLAPVMAEILQFYTDEDDAYSLHRLQCLQNLNSMYVLIHQASLSIGGGKNQAYIQHVPGPGDSKRLIIGITKLQASNTTKTHKELVELLLPACKKAKATKADVVAERAKLLSKFAK